MTSLAKAAAIAAATTWIASAGAPNVWVFDSLTRAAPASAAGTQKQMQIYAARGEYQSFQIGVQASSGALSNVNVAASALSGPGGATIPATSISLYREQFVTLGSGQTSIKSADGDGCTECPLGTGTYPDGLIPFTDPDTGAALAGAGTLSAVPFSVSAGQNQVIWVDVLVPRTATPGQYTGSFTITSDQGQSQVSLVLQVWNFTLPLQPSLKSAFLVWNDSHKQATDKELMRNRLMPDTTVNLSEATSLTSNFGLGGYGIQWYSGADYGNCNTDEAPPGVSEAQSAAAPYQQLGLLVYDYSFDEVDDCTNLYPAIIQWAQNLHKAGVDQLITMAPVQALFDDGLGTGRSAVDIWAMEPDVYVSAQSQNPPMASAALAKGDRIWAYQTLIQDDYSPKWLIDFAPVGARVMAGFISQSLSFSGLLYWKVDGWRDGTGAASWTDVYYRESGNTYPGEAILVYPGDPVGMPGKVAPSMRLKQLRDGEQDYEYVQLLKNMGQGAWALQVAATVGADYKNWSQDAGAVQSARIMLGQKLNTLSGGQPQVSIITNPPSLAFNATVDGPASPPVENIAIGTSTGAAVNFSVSAKTNGGSWLAATAAQGTTPASIGITTNPSGLVAGTYTGSVTISSSGASSQAAVPVTLTVAPKAPVSITIIASPAALNFSGIAGGTPPAAQPLSVSSSGTLAGVSAAVPSGANWLQVKTGPMPGTFVVSVNGSGLAAGSYRASIAITAAGASALTVPVSFTLNAPPTATTAAALSVSVSSVSLNASKGGGAVYQDIAVSGPAGGQLQYSISASTSSGGAWLIAKQMASSATLRIKASPRGLSPGTYTGSVSLIVSNTRALTIPVIFRVTK